MDKRMCEKLEIKVTTKCINKSNRNCRIKKFFNKKIWTKNLKTLSIIGSSSFIGRSILDYLERTNGSFLKIQKFIYFKELN